MKILDTLKFSLGNSLGSTFEGELRILCVGGGYVNFVTGDIAMEELSNGHPAKLNGEDVGVLVQIRILDNQIESKELPSVWKNGKYVEPNPLGDIGLQLREMVLKKAEAMLPTLRKENTLRNLEHESKEPDTLLQEIAWAFEKERKTLNNRNKKLREDLEASGLEVPDHLKHVPPATFPVKPKKTDGIWLDYTEQ